MERSTYTWTIIEKNPEVSGVFSLVLEAKDERPDFIAGQYLTVRLPNFEPIEGKSYSISSAPHETYLTLTIKEMGSFSRAILAREIGTTLTTSAPYGFFYPDTPLPDHLVFIAGGIGITPCMSIIRNLTHTGTPPRITLLYSSRTRETIIFRDELALMSEQFPTLTTHHFITRETIEETEHLHNTRIGADTFTKIPHLNTADFFICGSIDFTKCMWSLLREHHIPTTKIYTEGFF
jgi:ferredoxin-NADP reductase